MATRKVAVDGEVSATVGKTPYTGADSGTWTAGTVSYTSYPRLKVGGTDVIWKAECTFSFSGKSGSTSVNGQEKVTLEASSTSLQKGRSGVLIDGDQTSSEYGNQLSVTAAGKLTSG